MIPADKRVAVLGLGYVGLPMASLCASAGYEVVGFDLDVALVDRLSKRQCPIRDDAVESMLSAAVTSGRLAFSTKVDDIADASVYLVCVPSPVDSRNEPDLAPLLGACRSIGSRLGQGDLVVIETTVYPGICEQVVLPLLEELSGLVAGDTFYLAHCPERVNPGDPFWHSGNIPRVIGATCRSGLDLAAEFYASILGGGTLDVRGVRRGLYPKFRDGENGLQVSHVALGSITRMNSIRDAEAVKAMENTVRDVNIAFVNELAKISDALGLDVVDIIDGMATKPFGKGPFYPGVGVGGHCIAVDPEWLRAASERAGYIPEMIQLARTINNGMPEYTASILQDLLNQRGYPLKDTGVAILGVAYKRNVDDPRESPYYPLRDILLAKGARLSVYDSWVPLENTAASVEECLQGCKAIVIVTEHSDIIEHLRTMDLRECGIEVVVDGRNCLDGDTLTAGNILYRGIGRRVPEVVGTDPDGS